MTKLVKIVVLGILALGISACGDGTPSCDSGEVTNDVIKKVESKYPADFKIKLSDIIVKSMNKDTKKIECKATTNVETNFRGSWAKVYVDYTAQRTSDGRLIVKATPNLFKD